MFAETASSHCNRTSRDSEMTFRDPVPRNRLEQSGEASQEIQRIVGTARDRSSFSHEPYRIGCARGANEKELSGGAELLLIPTTFSVRTLRPRKI